MKRLPYEDPDRLAMAWTTVADEGIRESPSAYANIEDWRGQSSAFEDLATFDPTSLTLGGGSYPEQISTARASANLFSVLGVGPAIGRVFSSEEERLRTSVVVLSHGLWQRRFDGSPEIIGRTIEIGSRAFEVIGVMPEAFAFPDRVTELWMPQTLFTDWDADAAQRGTGVWRVVGRIRSDVALEQARDEMSLVARRLEENHPTANAGLGVRRVLAGVGPS